MKGNFKFKKMLLRMQAVINHMVLKRKKLTTGLCVSVCMCVCIFSMIYQPHPLCWDTNSGCLFARSLLSLQDHSRGSKTCQTVVWEWTCCMRLCCVWTAGVWSEVLARGNSLRAEGSGLAAASLLTWVRVSGSAWDGDDITDLVKGTFDKQRMQT